MQGSEEVTRFERRGFLRGILKKKRDSVREGERKEK